MHGNTFHFPGITFIVPKQRNGGEIIAVNKGINFPEEIPQRTDNFTVIRYVGNIVLYDQRDKERIKPICKFGPAIEIRVGYNFNDVMECKMSLHELKLAYWDGKAWVIFSDDDHDYHILPPSTGQIAEAKINNWAGDPPIAWGR